MTLGFEKPLYILPFDHRGSFQTNLFGQPWPRSLAVTGNGWTFSRKPYLALNRYGAAFARR